MTLFEVIDGLPEETREQRLASLDAWNEARSRYLERNFTEAAELFAKLGEAGDLAGELYAERCGHLAKMDVQPDWDGSFVWTVK